MPTYRLYTRNQDYQSLDQCFVTLDLTPLDFRSIPLLSYYVKYWFTDVDDLIDFLPSALNQRITLIVSDLLANITCHVLRPIFPQIVRIIILGKRPCQCVDIDRFPNARTLVDHLSILLRNRQRLYITFHSWPIERTANDLNKQTAKFLWYSYFYTILLRLKNTGVARAEMLKSVQAFHTKQIDVVKRSCEEFQQSYHPNDIIRWYTREYFFCLLLNRTLRSEDINHIFAMRYIIFDLENYLQERCHENRNNSIDIVYRGQQMHSSEIQEMEANVGSLIGLTTFWSTSRIVETALAFTEIWRSERADSVENVLFTIRIPSHVEQAVYFDISQFNTIGSEFEVLFSFRSVFRVERVTKNGNDEFWHIHLVLIDDTDDQFVSIMHPWYSSMQDIIGQRRFFTPQTIPSKQNFFRNLTLDNGPFLAFQLLVDMMLRLDRNTFARDELLQVCREHYSNDPIELKKIDEFERRYNARDATQWYTTDCFLYRIINSSLRVESIDLIFKLRYFIHDLHNQLAEAQPEFLRLLSPNQSTLRLYRGLTMNLHELNELQQNKGNLVSTNSFLSTTTDYEAALFFAGDGNVEENSVSAIYKIDIDTTVKHSIPFAKVDYQSIFKAEVLFSMAAVFRVGEIKQLKDRLWTIKLTLTPTDDEQWNVLLAHLKRPEE
jgi:hypothetical protein